MTDEQMLKLQRDNGYLAVRRLADGSIAVLCELLFTRSICLGADKHLAFTTRRFCFENRAWADREFALLQSKDDIPEGWIAHRGLPLPPD